MPAPPLAADAAPSRAALAACAARRAAAQRSACGCRLRLSVSLPITESSVGRPIADRPRESEPSRPRQLPSAATSSPRRPGAMRACPRAIRSASRPPCPSAPGRAARRRRRRRRLAPALRSQERAAVARDDRAAAQVRQIDAPGLDEREQLGGVDRRGPERDPLHLARPAAGTPASRARRARRRRAATTIAG